MAVSTALFEGYVTFSDADVGLHFDGTFNSPSPCDVWPGTSVSTDQYVTEVQDTLRNAVQLPLITAVYPHFPKCSLNANLVTNATSQRGAVDYVIRKSSCYQWNESHYGCQFPANLEKNLRTCLLQSYKTASLETPVMSESRLLAMLDLHRENGTLVIGQPGYVPPPVPANLHTTQMDGRECPANKTYVPLKASQCSLLNAAEKAHMDHDQALVDCLRATNAQTVGDVDKLCPYAATLEPAVISTNVAFQQSALSVDQAAMFVLIFQSYVNPGLLPKMVADLTENVIMPAHAKWTAAFHCDTGGEPEDQTAQFWRQVHQLGHSLRAMPVGQQQVLASATFDTPCIAALTNPSGVDNCPHMTASQFAATMQYMP